MSYWSLVKAKLNPPFHGTEIKRVHARKILEAII